jgi:hypothetical protein
MFDRCRQLAKFSLPAVLVTLLLGGVWLARERQAVLARREAREKLHRTIAAIAPPADAHWRPIDNPGRAPKLLSAVRRLLGDEWLATIRFPRPLSMVEIEYIGKWFPEAEILVAMEPGPNSWNHAGRHGRHGPHRGRGPQGTTL